MDYAMLVQPLSLNGAQCCRLCRLPLGLMGWGFWTTIASTTIPAPVLSTPTTATTTTPTTTLPRRLLLLLLLFLVLLQLLLHLRNPTNRQYQAHSKQSPPL